MRNRDEPAFPVEYGAEGLTKREYAAIHMMAGMKAAGNHASRTAEWAVTHVDELFDILEATND